MTPRKTGPIIPFRPLKTKGLEDFELDEKLQHMLRDLRRALADAISESPDANRALRRFREEGYSLFLLVDGKRDRDRDRDRDNCDESLALTVPRFSSGAGEPIFQIDGRDLSFLRSIGIDPTRRLRRRRSSNSPAI